MAAPPMNALLVVMDSVRADHLACYGDPSACTPHLDALAADGVRFANAQSESTWTLPMVFTTSTGLTPREHRGEVHRVMPEGMPTLAGLLKQAGYATFGASGNGWLANTRFSTVFDRFFVPREEGSMADLLRRKVHSMAGQSDRGGGAMVRHFAQWLPGQRGPWFAKLWFNDAHHGYRAPGWTQVQPRGHRVPFWKRGRITAALRHPRRLTQTPELHDYLEALYANAVTHVDGLVGQLLETLDRQGLTDNTLVIVGADHGDMLAERGLIGHGPASGMYQGLVHVPLIMRAPGVPAAVSPAIVQMADVPHTIATMAGVAQGLAPTAVERVDLRVAASGWGRSAAFSERDPLSDARLKRELDKAPRFNFAPHLCEMTTAVADGWKLINRRPGTDELYHLAEDPREELDLLGEQPQRAEFLRSLIADFHARASAHASTANLLRDDSEIVDRRLKDLGYL